MSNARVPQAYENFNSYINLTYNTLTEVIEEVPGWRRLGLTEEEYNEWRTFKDEWNENYEKSTDPAQRTKSVVAMKNSVKEEFTEFARIPLIRISASPNIMQTDFDRFRIKLRSGSGVARPKTSLGFVGRGSLRRRRRRRIGG
jgi:hypothetical protein